MTTDNTGEFGYNYEPAGFYCKASGNFGFGGTSAAAAQVASVVALMLGANRDLKSQPERVRHILRAASSHEHLKWQLAEPTASDVSHDKKRSREFGFGLVDAKRAVRLALGLPPEA